MKKLFFISFSSLILIMTGCSNNNEQLQTAKEPEAIKMDETVKKAPKREVVKRIYTKKKLKYRDTSESSKVRVYDPETKSLVNVEEEKEIIPTSDGGKIFFSKGCNLCHKAKENRLGPSLKKLARGYKNKQSELILYLQRKGEAIIQPERGSIMKTQLVKLRILSENEYNQLSKYILSGGKTAK